MDIEKLRCRLFDAVSQDDRQLLAQLYGDHHQTIVAHFKAWAQVPAEIQNNAEAVHAWGTALHTVAQHLDVLGIPGPLAWLTDARRPHIANWWYRAFERARLLGQVDRFEEAYKILQWLLREVEGVQGELARDLRPKVLGLLGSNRVGAGDLAAAIEWTNRALSECQGIGDGEGVRVYRENLQALKVLQLLRVDSAAGSHLLACRRVIVKAQDLSDRGHYRRSNDLLQEALNLIGDDDHSPLHDYRAKVLGQLGWNYFQLQEKTNAQECTEQALDICRATDDADGIRIYTVNLATIEKE